MEFRKGLGGAWLLPLTLVFTIGCDRCDHPDPLVIADPLEGSILGNGSDADPSLAGLQYDVAIDVKRLAEGETVRVYTDASVLDTDPNAATPYEATVAGEGRLTVRVTMTNGAHALVACARDACRVRSKLVNVTVGGGCTGVTFLAPVVGTDAIRLGPMDDVATSDGACGATFATNVRAEVPVPDGTVVRLYVNDVPSVAATVSGRVADFGSVTLGARGLDPNVLSARVVGEDPSCSVDLGQPILVGCPGPTCRVDPPSPTDYLNASLDTDAAAPGLDLDLSATSAENAAGQLFQLVVDGQSESAVTATSVAEGGSSRATFGGVSLAEGGHVLQATCTDGVATTQSALAIYTVDTVPCGVSISAPAEHSVIDASADLDGNGANGIQVGAAGLAVGSDCRDARVDACSSIGAVAYVPLDGSGFTGTATLGTSTNQTVCADVRDVAGNVAQAQVTIDVLVGGAPSLSIVTPANGTRVNRLGNDGVETYDADLDPNSDTCELDFVVDCSVVGTDVSLVVDGQTTGARTAACVANASSALGGRATFTNVSLPVDVSAHAIRARQVRGGVTGQSDPITVDADCKPPAISFASPVCGSTLGTADDQSPAPGLQHDVVVDSPNIPQVEVDLTVMPNGGGTTTLASAAGNAVNDQHTFGAVELGGAGAVQLAASASDAFLNVVTTPACSLTITGRPTLVLDTYSTPPFATPTFNTANAASFDCSPDSGLQLTVSGTTNATAGSQLTIAVGALTPVATTVAAGAPSNLFSVCVDVPQGTSTITVTVTDTVASDGVDGTSTATQQILVGTTAPPDPISGIQVTLPSVRGGDVLLTFSAVGDAVGAPLASYELRCAKTAIDVANDWTAASVVTSATIPVPASPGTSQTISIHGLRTGTSRHCLVRGFDAAQNPTPIANGNSVLVEPAFHIVQRNGTIAGAYMGFAGAIGVGNVGVGMASGDANRPDILVSGRGSAYLFFGASTLGTGGPDVTFRKTPASNTSFGNTYAPLGDFNGDGRPDFAIGDYDESSSRGAIYVFFGRTDANPWPSLITLSAATCAADLCIRGGGAGDYTGFSLAGIGDFDGDGRTDLATSLSLTDRVLVLLGHAPASGTAYTMGTSNPDGFLIPGTPSSPGAGDFGWTVIGLGDDVGDARADIALLRPDNTNFTAPTLYWRVAGRAHAASGLTTLTAADLESIVNGQFSLEAGFGTVGSNTASVACDFDGDGAVDLCACSGVSDGAYAFYGAGFDARTHVPVSTAPNGDDFGWQLSPAYHPALSGLGFPFGDIDGDGVLDLLGAASSTAADAQPAAGLVYGRAGRPGVILRDLDVDSVILKPLPLPSAAGAVLNPPERTVGFVGDVDGDGRADFVVGDPAADGANASGRIFLYH